MAPKKSLDEIKLIAAYLHDVHKTHGAVFSTKACRQTIQLVQRRAQSEGISFLTKTLPRLGKALDRVLAGGPNLNARLLRFEALANSSDLPRFLGEFFRLVLHPNGSVLPTPCVESVRVLREVLYLFYKYELPYTEVQEHEVIQRFEKTEEDLKTITPQIDAVVSVVNAINPLSRRLNTSIEGIARDARILLQRVFEHFDPKDIWPRHGPGVVATKQRLWEKYHWTNISAKIASMYPIDEYFFSSLGHVCDRYQEIQSLGSESLPARVLLVPKDSRGPRLISCEPVDYQWIQQGLGRAIMDHVEKSPITKSNVFFTDQTPNQLGALAGSLTGAYSTLDLNEASDRVSVSLVRLLFPPHIYAYLEACRSTSTVLPCGRRLELLKFAPMGSALCFPVLALTTWAILAASAPDKDTRDRILVYGDDVIVPTAFAADAIEQLESFGLKVNRDKSCISGFFRESCGTDAFKGFNVTPVRLRTVWSSTPSPGAYCSWIAYANTFYDKSYFDTYDYIVSLLTNNYGEIPSKAQNLSAPSLSEVPEEWLPSKSRFNRSLQKREWKVRTLIAPSIQHDSDGWERLLRYHIEKGVPSTVRSVDKKEIAEVYTSERPFSSGSYTRRGASKLVSRWR